MLQLLEKKQEIIKDYQLHEGDSGSVFVQIALLTTRINYLSDHLKTHKKDFSAKRTLLMMVAKRQNFLKYLKKNYEQAQFDEIVTKLGIRIKKSQ